MNLYLVRHGQTLLNTQDRLRGWMDPELAPEGVAEARQLAGELELQWETAIFCSDLLRARQTADVISKRTGYMPTATAALRP
jgi:probable phosphoglycerate mutase